MKNSHDTTRDVKQHVCGAAAAVASTREPSPPLSHGLFRATETRAAGATTAVCCTFRSTVASLSLWPLPLSGGATL